MSNYAEKINIRVPIHVRNYSRIRLSSSFALTKSLLISEVANRGTELIQILYLGLENCLLIEQYC